MKAFIDRIFRNKKLKEEAQIEENKRILKEQIETAIETKIEEVKEDLKQEVFAKPGHYFADCNCFKCLRWRNQNAK